jgi:hypothetical protein
MTYYPDLDIGMSTFVTIIVSKTPILGVVYVED